MAALVKTRNQDALVAVAAKSRSAKQQVDPAALKTMAGREPGASANRAKGYRASCRCQEDGACSCSEAMASASEHHFERNSVVDERLLLREALIAGRGRVSLENYARS